MAQNVSLFAVCGEDRRPEPALPGHVDHGQQCENEGVIALQERIERAPDEDGQDSSDDGDEVILRQHVPSLEAAEITERARASAERSWAAAEQAGRRLRERNVFSARAAMLTGAVLCFLAFLTIGSTGNIVLASTFCLNSPRPAISRCMSR